ncbi:hypothetical protein [Effusibacillus lacus]|uniref:Uncharacterized protein n=1 Tax=Effusibacillus lacus TaxID=1348429 RepID=A0A292YJH5_9BACL|nr:hypothetical protein [Effusibacillus lacus]TCS74721.1 hypothetical protein EDD64_1117 [Effusibacillus lacus]GAX88534.1 hypothetical protein EFBL_0143 [Effusibacillus lacus]
MIYVVRTIFQNRILNEKELVVPDDISEDQVVELELARIREVYPEADCYIAERKKG